MSSQLYRPGQVNAPSGSGQDAFSSTPVDGKSSANPVIAPSLSEKTQSDNPTSRMNVAPTGGLRDNKGKPNLAIVPMSLNVAVAEVLQRSSTDGGGKYPMHNWRKGLYFVATASCALRHIYKWLAGEELDEETGLHHLKHAACNIAFLLEYIETHPELDDRYKGAK